MIKILILLSLNSFVLSDIYLHNPRGSNNRLDESGRERDNEKRLFDSQNNDRGGYNVGNLYYYTESKLQIEWTNQHSCSSPNANCDIILQYMCDDSVRDGSDTRQIPESNSQCLLNNCATDYRFGQNENNKYYSECKRRFRNKRLFTADQKLGDFATSTRQNPNSIRYGYECAEERDYYPYWQPTPWIDIAILTNNPKKCDYFQNESENVKTRWFCTVPNNYTGNIPNNKIDCEKMIPTALWTESKLITNLQKPICQESQFTRDNHLGNTYGGNPPVFNWTLPSIPGNRCVLRIRYNISTNDYSSFDTNISTVNNNLANKMKLNQNDANSRGFIFKNKPNVQIFSDFNFSLNLAIDTSQYGRTFQDRSHVFEIKQRPSNLQNKKIENLNVRGKRGNIVQVYPAVEYDFVPNKLEISKNDFIHIQWTGSNKNPRNNDGQGLAGSDRSNMVLLTPKVYAKGNNQFYSPLELNGQYGINYPINLVNSTLFGFDMNDLTKLALLNQYGGSMDELDDASPYFDLGPKQITQTNSVYHYMSTRNNNFSNRDQKGEVIVYDFAFVQESLGTNGGTITDNKFELKIAPGTFSQLVNIRVEVKSKDQILNELEIMNNKQENFDFDSVASDFIVINFSQNPNNSISTQISLNNAPQLMQTTSMYRINSDFSLITKIPLKASECSNKVNMDISYPGIYVAKNESSYTVLIICLTVIISFCLIGTIIGLFLWRNPKYLERIRYTACNTKLSMSDQL